MDVALRADELTAHIVDPVRRNRVRNSLLKQLQICEAIGKPDRGENDTAVPYKDGCDDVPVITPADLQAKEKQRLTNLRDLHRELQRHASSTVVDEDDEEDPVNTRGKFGYTALHRAVIDGDIPAVKNLLHRKARKDILDASGFSPIQWARMKIKEPGMPEIVSLLKR